MIIRMLIPLIMIISITSGQKPLKEKPQVGKFLEIKVDDPNLQREIDALRGMFQSDLAQLKQKHKEEKKSLRKSYKEKLKALRKNAKQKRKKQKRPGN